MNIELLKARIESRRELSVLESMEKAKAQPIGSTRMWAGVEYKKVSTGMWRPVKKEHAEKLKH